MKVLDNSKTVDKWVEHSIFSEDIGTLVEWISPFAAINDTYIGHHFIATQDDYIFSLTDSEMIYLCEDDYPDELPMRNKHYRVLNACLTLEDYL